MKWGRTIALGLGALLVAGVAWRLQRPPPPLEVTVKRGDTLWALARDHAVTVEQIQSWNALDGDRIEVGQVLLVHTAEPGEAAAAGSSAERTSGRRTSRRRASQKGRGRTAPPAQVQEAAGGLSKLTRPNAMDCLAGPSDLADSDAADSDDGDEPMMAASAGLDQRQVNAALRAFEPNLARCLSRDDEPAVGVVRLTLNVACTGQVASVEIADDGGLPEAACVADTLRYAAFPAHDMPDGFTFDYPVRFAQR